MKVKTDFVTNSSSSSYILIGTTNSDVIIEYIKSLVWSKVLFNNILNELKEKPYDEIDNSNWDRFTEEYEKYFKSIDHGIYEVGDLIHCVSYYDIGDFGSLGLGVEDMLVQEGLNYKQMKNKIIQMFSKKGIKVEEAELSFDLIEHSS